MAASLRTVLAIVALGTLVPAPARGQVLTIGDTLGRGKAGVLLTDNELYAGDGIRLNIAYGEFARGLTDRFDLYLSAGEVRTDGTSQAFVGGGGNLRLVKAGAFSVSAFNVASIPLNRRDEACVVLLNSALVVSRAVGSKAFVYSGVNSLIPIGERARGVFTPPDTRVNVPIGGTYAFGPWGVWGEFDAGSLKAIGVGITRVF